MNSILITGGAGFIGSTLANYYSAKNRVIVIDDLSMGMKSNLVDSDAITFIEGNVTDERLMKEVFSKYSFDYVFHFAAIASVADSVERPVETHKVNFDSTFYMLELLKQHKSLKRIVFASSAAVYGDEPTLPKKEESVIRPLTPYAVDKFAAEKYVIDYYHLYGIPTSAVRFFNVYGPNQNPNSPYSGVISILMDRYKQIVKGEKVEFILFGDGGQSRDFVFIEDVIQSLDLIAKSADSLGETFNIGTGKSVSLAALIDILNHEIGVVLPIRYELERSGDIKHSVADIEKIRGLGYTPKFDINDGISKYVTYEINKEES